jgi:hypothetical protein
MRRSRSPLPREAAMRSGVRTGGEHSARFTCATVPTAGGYLWRTRRAAKRNRGGQLSRQSSLGVSGAPPRTAGSGAPECATGRSSSSNDVWVQPSSPKRLNAPGRLGEGEKLQPDRRPDFRHVPTATKTELHRDVSLSSRPNPLPTASLLGEREHMRCADSGVSTPCGFSPLPDGFAPGGEGVHARQDFSASTTPPAIPNRPIAIACRAGYPARRGT